ncbi:hypothetical protein Acsp06_26040 [Actinomycetospora sp. NBRC 106375]|uniref:maleylpyruvate isomerase family mycothiol-dependent enzyme n=1 Tax=Actinomycetospora sp. NBRC 106375 TaxID=3032207 RepID=UPI0024A21C32|nr:maleylpyruvate isomerase family mycothiol-dependent enzyme [Actinomycetospora sp. NBRC 106375]GLZ46419.1 hypothetical protein Acsp06_26040 [Actinomycetospora sp. NBRC 106375]
MLSADEAREAMRREWGRVVSTVARLDDAALAAPTRCAGWTVLDLARHLAWATSMEADALRRARLGATGVAEGRHPGVDADTVRAGLADGVDALLAELDRGVLALDALLPLPTGAVPMAFGSQVLVLEAGVHADDVENALGRDEPLASDVVTACAVVLALALPAFATLAGSAATAPAPGTVVAVTSPHVSARCRFAAEGWTVVDGGTEATERVQGDDDTAVLRFALGRLPAGDPRLRLSPGAADFKRWFPGP